MTEPSPAAEAPALAAAKTATPPPSPPAPAPAAAPSSAALRTAASTEMSNVNSAISQAGTVNSGLALATSSCKRAITWLAKATAAAPTA
jgi:hypothetical protein